MIIVRTRSPRGSAGRRLVCWACLGLGCALAWAPLVGAAAPAPPTDGLDVVLLVDVSASMSGETRDRQNRPIYPPSDPERRRWDAVLLILNMLTVEDRVMILAFNDQAPARAPGGARPIPGPIPSGFLSAEEARSRLVPQIAGFISDPNPIDGGQTGIFNALATTARQLDLAGPPPSNRRRSAILLTDGFDSFVGPDRTSQADFDAWLRRELGSWTHRSGRVVTPVYTIGLGHGSGDGLLKAIAKVTEGGFFKVPNNRTIVETFRDLIWSLKGCWTRRIDLNGPGADLQALRGIDDVGVLAFRAEPDGTVRPLPSPTRDSFAFDPMSDLAPRVEVRVGRGGGSYRYFYLGRQAADEERPFGNIDVDRYQLKTTWDDRGDGRDFLYYALRTPHVLFELRAPEHEETFLRHQPFRVRVEMHESKYFLAGDFQLEIALKPSGAPASVRPVAVKLERVVGLNRFEADMPLAVLPRTPGAAVDDFDLIVTASGVGRPGDGKPLRGCKITLPARTFTVRNTFELVALESIELTREAPSRTLHLRAKGKVRGKLPISLAIQAPSVGARPLGADALLLSVGNDSPRPLGGTTIALELVNGEVAATIALNPNHFPASGDYRNGRLSLDSDQSIGLVPLSVPLGIQIDAIRLRTTPESLTVTTAVGGGTGGPIEIGVDPPARRAQIKERVRVALLPDASDAPRFAPEELWLESTGAAGKNSLLSLGIGQTFDVHFEPKALASKVGRWPYVWELSGQDKDSGIVPFRGRLWLEITPPRLIVDPRALSEVPTSPGQFGETAIKYRFEPTIAGQWMVGFEAQHLSEGLPLWERIEGEKVVGQTTAIELTAPPRSYDPQPPGGWDEFGLSYKLPSDLPHGHYRLVGKLVSHAAIAALVDIRIVVDALRVFVRPRGRDWTLLDDEDLRVVWKRVVEQPMTKQLRFETVLGRLLPHEIDSFKLEPKGPYECDRNDALGPRRYPKEVRRQRDGNAVVVTFTFPEVVSPVEEVPYRIKVVVSCPSLKLDPRELMFVTTFQK